MPETSSGEILIELGAEPLDSSGFEHEESETGDENTIVNLEVTE